MQSNHAICRGNDGVERPGSLEPLFSFWFFLLTPASLLAVNADTLTGILLNGTLSNHTIPNTGNCGIYVYTYGSAKSDLLIASIEFSQPSSYSPMLDPGITLWLDLVVLSGSGTIQANGSI